MPVNENMPNPVSKYICEKCDFKCSKQSNYTIHLATDKHKRLSSAISANENNATVCTCACGEQYSHRSSLSRHKKKCTYIKSETTNHETQKPLPEQTMVEQPDGPDLYGIINLLIKENQEIRNLVITQHNTIVKNQQPTTNNSHNNNNNQNYNINMFLTDKCKDAQNMSDFIEVLKNKVDMIQIYEKGYVGGISKLFIDELKSMEVTERPLHCTDERRNTFYVHNNDTWNKDENLKDTKKAICHVSQTNLQQCVAWSKNVPEGGASREEHITRSIRLCKEACSGGDDTKVDKIIKNISKEIPLNKQVISDILV